MAASSGNSEINATKSRLAKMLMLLVLLVLCLILEGCWGSSEAEEGTTDADAEAAATGSWNPGAYMSQAPRSGVSESEDPPAPDPPAPESLSEEVPQGSHHANVKMTANVGPKAVVFSHVDKHGHHDASLEESSSLMRRGGPFGNLWGKDGEAVDDVAGEGIDGAGEGTDLAKKGQTTFYQKLENWVAEKSGESIKNPPEDKIIRPADFSEDDNWAEHDRNDPAQSMLAAHKKLIKATKNLVQTQQTISAQQLSSTSNQLNIQHLQLREDSVEDDFKNILEELKEHHKNKNKKKPPKEPEDPKFEIWKHETHAISPSDPSPPDDSRLSKGPPDDSRLSKGSSLESLRTDQGPVIHKVSGQTAAHTLEFQKLQERVTHLEAERLPFSVNRHKHEVLLQNFNLHVHSSAHEHGVGNLVVGDENDVLGASNSIVQGYHNLATGEGVAVIGGYDNIGNGDLTTVTGGHTNMASGLAASVAGGVENQATGLGASVAGGDDNVAAGKGAVVLGGEQNDATGGASVVAGGSLNIASGKQTAAFAGFKNEANGPNAATYLGYANKAEGNGVGIFGGEYSTASQHGKVLVGKVGHAEPEDQPDCAKCSLEFANNGGCIALKEGNTAEVLRLRPANDLECAPCAAYAEHACRNMKLPDFSGHTGKGRCQPCVVEFNNQGGCAAWELGNWEQVMAIVTTLEDGCRDCATYAEDHCASLGAPITIVPGQEDWGIQGPPIEDQEKVCPQCTEEFVLDGGCEAWKDEKWEKLHEIAPTYGSKCFECETHVAEHCQIPMKLRGDMGVRGHTKQKDECKRCVKTFMKEGGCDVWKSGNWPELDRIAPKVNDPCYGCESWAADDCHIPLELRGTQPNHAQDIHGGWHLNNLHGLHGHGQQFSGGVSGQCEKCMGDFKALGGCDSWQAGNWDKFGEQDRPCPGS